MRILVAAFVLAASLPAGAHPLTFEERVEARRAIEAVYWKHRIWPRENPGEKPALSAVLSEEALEAKVKESLRGAEKITPDRLQAEVERMAARTRDPGILQELFDALGNDPSVFNPDQADADGNGVGDACQAP
jgi:hypothetical protein